MKHVNSSGLLQYTNGVKEKHEYVKGVPKKIPDSQ